MDVLHFVDGIPPFKVKYLTLKEGKKKKNPQIGMKQSNNNLVLTDKLTCAGLTVKRDLGNRIPKRKERKNMKSPYLRQK